MSGMFIIVMTVFCIFVGIKVGKELGLWNRPGALLCECKDEKQGPTAHNEEKGADDGSQTEGRDNPSRGLRADHIAVLKKVFGDAIAPPPQNLDSSSQITDDPTPSVPQMQTFSVEAGPKHKGKTKPVVVQV